MPSSSTARFRSVGHELVAGIGNAHTKEAYRRALERFFSWWETPSGDEFDVGLVRAHVRVLGDSGLSPSTINQRLSAIRRLAGLAVEAGLIDLQAAADIGRISNFQRPIVPLHQTLQAAEGEALINAPSQSTTKGVRDRALIALLIGCGLRRGEIVQLQVESILAQNRQWLLAGVVGPRGRVRNVAVPGWVNEALQAWMRRAHLSSGPLLRSVDREGIVGSRMISPQTVGAVVAEHARSIGLEATPEDLRRTCARLCRDQGGEIHKIQIMLGHSSADSTERLLGRLAVLGRSPNVLGRMKWYNSKKVAS
jgi:integrase/recombinase XerD